MSILDSFRQLEEKHYIAYFLFFISIIAPGVLILYYFKHDEFITLEVSKILLLSISITTPLFFINATGVASIEYNMPHEKPDWHYVYRLGTVMTGLPIYLALSFTYFFKYGFKEFILFAIGFNIIILLLNYLFARSDKRKAEKENSELDTEPKK